VRTALLGSAALGDDTLVPRLQQMLDGADVEETIELLEALAASDSAEAAVSLRIALRDARPNVRRPAIRLYAARKDAQPDALIGAMTRQDDVEAQNLIAHILARQFPDAWARSLRQHLESGDERRMDTTLSQLRRVIRTEEQFEVLEKVKAPLLAIARGENREQATRAAFLLYRLPDSEDFSELMKGEVEPETWYAYMEHLVSHPSKDHLPVLREHLFADLYAYRLVSAAALWSLFPGKVKPNGRPSPSPEPAS
jgi:hypothetical protein